MIEIFKTQSKLLKEEMENISKIGLLIENIQKTLRRILKYEMKQRNLQEMNPSHGKVLFALSQNDMISIQELKERVALGSSTLTGILDHLEKLDMITRIHSKEDRRKILIRFNEKDYNKLENYKAIVKKLTKIIYQDFSEDEIKTFESNLIHIFQNLSEYEKSLN